MEHNFLLSDVSDVVNDSVPTTEIIPSASSQSTITSQTQTGDPTTLSVPPLSSSSSSPLNQTQSLSIILSLSIFFAIFFLVLFVIYIHTRRKRNQNLLSSTVSQVESGGNHPGVILDSQTGMSELIRQEATPSPTPLPPPPPPPSPSPPESPARSSTFGSSTIASGSHDGRGKGGRANRHRIETIQIEPMTRRVTMNLGDKGRNIVIRDRGDDHVVNVVTIQEEEVNTSGGSNSLRKNIIKRLLFWR